MDNNHFNNHICNNNHRRIERNLCGRIENEIMPRREDNCSCDEGKLYEHLEFYRNDNMSYYDGCDRKCKNEHGGEVYSLNVEKHAYKNNNFRETIWTGKYLQTTLMNIPCSQNVGIEIHEDTDQYIRVEYGYALLLTGENPQCLFNKKKLCKGDAVFIPAGTWHDIANIGKSDLKLSSVYAPPHHPKCTEHRYKTDVH